MSDVGQPRFATEISIYLVASPHSDLALDFRKETEALSSGRIAEQAANNVASRTGVCGDG